MKKYIIPFYRLSKKSYVWISECLNFDIQYGVNRRGQCVPKKMIIFWEDDTLNQFLYDMSRFGFQQGYYSGTLHNDNGDDYTAVRSLIDAIERYATIDIALNGEYCY